MKADKGNKRIAALQNDNDKMSSYPTSSAAHKLHTAARPPTVSERINAVADRIAMFENTKTADDSSRDNGASDLPKDELDAENVAVIKLDNDEEENGSNVKQTESSYDESASEPPSTNPLHLNT